MKSGIKEQTRQRSREMDKEQLIKLAVVAGYEFCDGSFWPTSEWAKKNGTGNWIEFGCWQPHNYIS